MRKIYSTILKFKNGQEGTISIIMAAALLVMFGGLAAAVDVTYTAAVQNDVRHVSKAICGRAASAYYRGLSTDDAVELSKNLGNELISKTSLDGKNSAFEVTIDDAAGKVSVSGRATVATSFMALFGVNSLLPTDTIQCNTIVAAVSPPPPPPASGGNCGFAMPGPNVANGGNSLTTGFTSTNSGPNSSSSNGSGSSANASGGFTGGNGITSGSTTTSNAGSNSLSCTTASNGNSSGSSFGWGTSGPGGTSSASSNVTLSSNGGASSGGGMGGGPNGGGGGGGGSFCVGPGC